MASDVLAGARMDFSISENGVRGVEGGSDPHRPQVLFLAHRFPFPPDKGDRIRTFHLLKALSRWSAVHLACLADEPVEASSLAVLGRYCERVRVLRLSPWTRWPRALVSLAKGGTVTAGAFRVPELGATLRRWAAETRFDAVVASASSMIPYLRTGPLRELPAVVDLVDVDSQKWLDYAAVTRGPRRWLYGLEGHRLRVLERELTGWAKAITLVSESEASLYRAFAGGAGLVHSIPNGVDLEYFSPPLPQSEQGCVFVGALDYRPNVDAVDWFCRAVWPEIHCQQPAARFSIVGRRPGPVVQRLSRVPGVVVVGEVSDVRPHVASAAVVIAPLRLARGIQNKVLEAMAMGKAVVASPQALEGLKAQPGVHLRAASSTQEWATTVIDLMNDPAQRSQLGSAARRFVEEHHSWDRNMQPFRSLLGLSLGSSCPEATPRQPACSSVGRP